MSKTRISAAIRRAVAKTAEYRCGYCLTQTRITGMPMQIDHIIPESLGGLSDEQNLWLACSPCNQYKGAKLNGIDPVTNQLVSLFNPRHQLWSGHFAWSQNSLHIIGLSPTGRATIKTLRMNNSLVVHSRSLWVQLGLHPPS